MNCICILKDTTFNRLNEKYKDEIEFGSVKSLDDLKQELTVIECDFVILDLNNYNYHDITEYLESKNIKIYIFDGKFNVIESVIEDEIKNKKEQEEEIKENEKEIKIVEKYIEVEKKVVVEKIIEREIEVEKIIEKKVYQQGKIAITSQKKGIGCTHYCFTFANYLSERDKNVAIVEIGENKLNKIETRGIDLLHFNNLEEYYASIEVRKYDYIIFDIGYYERDNFKEIFLPCDFKIAILGSKKYEMSGIGDFIKLVYELKIVNDIDYIFNFASKTSFEDLTYDMKELNVYRGIYNPGFEVNEEIEVLINDILQFEESNIKKSFKIDKIIIAIIMVVLVIIIYYLMNLK